MPSLRSSSGGTASGAVHLPRLSTYTQVFHETGGYITIPAADGGPSAPLALLEGTLKDGPLHCRSIELQPSRCVSNASTATFNKAKSWLESCISSHEACCDIQKAISALPTRLLSVNEKDSPTIRVVATQLLSTSPTYRVGYLAVSHCWGQSRKLKLTKANYRRLSTGFSETELPRLFRDCISVTRKLGYRYLWLDSLCIVQDSVEDWATEAAYMGDVYCGAVCTIAAVSAPDSDHSLFTKTHPLFEDECIVRGPIRGTESSAESNSAYCYFFDKCDVRLLMPLYSRAWVLQERLLSPRTLMYTHMGVGLVCGQATYAEYNTYYALNTTRLVNENWQRLLKLRASGLDETSCAEGARSWIILMNAYSHAKLTHESDRPHAIKGVVSTLEQQTGLKFVSGLWEDFLPISLLWRIAFEEYPAEQREEIASTSLIPSWSASLSRRIAYEGPQSRWRWKTASAKTRSHFRTNNVLYLDAKSYGPLRIRLKGDKEHFQKEFITAVEIELENWIPSRQLLSEAHISLWLDQLLAGPIEIYLVLLAESQTGHGRAEITEFYGLAITRATSGANYWRRIGAFSILSPEGTPSYRETITESIRNKFGAEREFEVY